MNPKYQGKKEKKLTGQTTKIYYQGKTQRSFANKLIFRELQVDCGRVQKNTLDAYKCKV